MIRSFLPIAICLASFQLFAQDSVAVEEYKMPEVFIGPGIGLDYGGMGLNIMVIPSKYVGLFVGVGYNLVMVGGNGGLRLYMNKPVSRVRPYISGMYGYHSAIKVENAKNLNKVFYGTSLGFGLDIRTRNERNYWTVAIHAPLNGSDANDYIEYLKSRGIKFDNKLLPVRFTLGLRIGVGKER